MLAAMTEFSPADTVRQHHRLDLDHLNEAQRDAVTHPHGPLLVIAGPGSGKTRVITHRIAWLIEQGIPPWRILAVTFTNRAAREMRTRLESLIGAEDSDRVWLGTFHRICVRMLRSHGPEIGVPRNFVIFDSDDQMQVVRNALKELQIDPKQYAPRALLSRISRAKSEGDSLADFRSSTGSYFDEIAARVWERYEAAFGDAAALDFDDLLLKTLEMFEHDGVRQIYEERFDHVLVDEFQDTSTIQYQLARAWSAGSGNLTVVGDPDQSIYSWRSADIRNLNYFVRDHGDAAEVQLNNNLPLNPADSRCGQRSHRPRRRPDQAPAGDREQRRPVAPAARGVQRVGRGGIHLESCRTGPPRRFPATRRRGGPVSHERPVSGDRGIAGPTRDSVSPGWGDSLLRPPRGARPAGLSAPGAEPGRRGRVRPSRQCADARGRCEDA